MKKEINRKEFLISLGVLGISAFSITSFLSGCSCNQNKPQTEDQSQPKTKQDPCTDTSGLTADELKNRKNLNYVGKSPFPDKYCANCNFFILPSNGAACGACQLVKGPINPNGHCNAWVAKQKS